MLIRVSVWYIQIMSDKNKKLGSIIKIILIGIGVIISLFIGFILILIYIVSPINASYDQLKYDRLNTEFKRVYREIVATSGDSIKWSYVDKCILGGGLNGYESPYTCSIELSAEIPTQEIKKVRELHDTYFPIIDKASFLTPKSNVLESFHSRKGEVVYIDSADKSYSSTIHENLLCTYLINIVQTDRIPSDHNPIGSSFTDGHPGIITIYFKCSGDALGDWYGFKFSRVPHGLYI